MTDVIFYQLEESADSTTVNYEAPASNLLAFACHLVAQCYSNNQRLSVFCADQAQAEAFDEMLWQLPADRFIAHNLAGEGPKGGANVEISWPKQSALRSIVVNLSALEIPEPNRYQKIYDFVPNAEDQKQAARLRYAQCKQAGCQMQFAKASDIVAS